MNYLKSITSSVLSSTGVSFPFTIGERIPGTEAGASVWEIREGVKKDDGSPVTLFIFDATLPPLQPGNKDRRTLFQLAKNALKKLRTIRHPDVIKYIDSVETETHIYIATEPVRPVQAVLRDWGTGGALTGSAAARGKAGKEAWLGWGVRSISTALAFLNAPPLSQHHAYLIPSTVFITPAMEWRLGGFELLTGRDDGAGVLWGLGGVAPGNAGEYSSPEVKKGGWGVLRDTDPAFEDTYLLAMWLFWLFNPEKPPPQLSTAPTPAMAGAIPKRLFPLWKRMVNPNARTRLSTTNFVAEAQASGIWSDNPLVSLVDGLDGFELRSDGEKAMLLRTIKDAAEGGSLPEPFLVHRVLPSLLHSLSLPNAPSAQMLPLVLALGKQVPPSTYAKVVLDPVIKLFASPDRGTRMALLDGLDEYADRLDKHMVTDRIWPHLTTGFADTVPVIREATIKAVYPLASKLSDRILNNDLLRLLAKMQQDQEASIRTNTCILLGRLAPMLGPNTKKKVLVPAFARSLKDSFVHARVAALMALMATVECYDRDDLAGRVIPNMAHALVDKEKIVRDQAFKAMAMFVKRVEEMVASMPATVLTETERPTSPQHAAGAGMVTSAAGAAGSLAGWAFSSLGKHLQTGEANSAMTAAPGVPAHDLPSPNTSSFGSPAASRRESADATRPSARLNSFSASASVSASRKPAPGMKLAHTKQPNLMDELANELDDDVANAWGDDLMDVNADTDDWTAFESAAPVVEAPPPQSYYVAPKAEPLPAPKPVKAKPKPAPAAASAPAPPAGKAPPPVASPVSESSKPATPVPSLAGMSKEEKEKEMARRREERKARIAAMKEQKKGKA
ncbi:hypothetical protein CC85DRAFT_256266 [Cutaneotrichosporon oleaginosum]|uniref:Protein kinase domain-containing protein n=1 Tax=Cutaneotrichosporon oleaginosum TaxID=879819 RepID=A0A0J0XUP1_9TREE|nr:uncharacterized protein CC85DRAFT_256266 [Cutaneotrichosporon oleaginosum]KLT44816.1 hypothetical protein CC85DRAFT_256266 [Cutaneotrichosporon oleaginosum]TXT11955.1 hypothetical protein COLE_02365 [Cutaneotrichosporon oleaginosum]